MDKSNITAICTTLNDENSIEDLISDICKQTINVHEIILVDGGSRDRTVDIIKSLNLQQLRLYEKRNYNISQGLNYAITKTKTEYIVVFMAGNRYDKLYIEQMRKCLHETSEKVVYAPIRGISESVFGRKYIEAFLNGEKGSRIPSNHGALIEKSVFSAYGLFYEGFYYAGEDAEFYGRLKRSGVIMKCAEEAYVWWQVPDSLTALRKQAQYYMIADNQIKGLASLLKFKWLVLRLLCYLLSLVLSMVTHQAAWGIGFLVLLINVLFNYIKAGFDYYVAILRMTRLVIQFYYSVKHVKFMFPPHRVNIQIISKL